MKEVVVSKAKLDRSADMFGGASIVSTFRQYDLIDEYRPVINPVEILVEAVGER
ncbi:hypothetical protein ACLMAJ_30335 [Nocardia sp. KC 131]|uniref:hypothetical protein n=1 Tax=Nocardia arseniciresistens TaxID=3392119 RepID=UPI00398E48A0